MTLYSRILTDIQNKIMSGEWPPGYRLPFETDLTKEYGCSRMTANKAMSCLAQLGLIERRRKSGSFVALPRTQSAVLEIRDIKDEVTSLDFVYEYHLLSKRIKKHLEIGQQEENSFPTDNLLEIVCLHLAGGRPFCLENRLINLSAVPEAAEIDFVTIAPGPWLLAKVPWINARHQIQAVAASKSEGKLLEVAPSYPCLVVKRRTWGPSGAVTDVRLIYPGERHVVTADFRPGDIATNPKML